MNPIGAISSIGYVSMRAKDLGSSITTATDILGLREVEEQKSKVYLAAQQSHHEIIYTESTQDAVDHIGLVASTPGHLEDIRQRVRRAGYPILSEHPIEADIDDGFAFVGPEGFTWHIYTEQTSYSITKNGGFGPNRFGHVNIKSLDPITQRDFLAEIFDFRVSDRIGHDVAFFMRCNNEHHGVAVFKNDRVGLHHHAWQTQGIEDLGRLGDRLARRGARLAWGPVRHGAGDNIAAYFVEPTGAVIELYTDLELVFDPERPERLWDENDDYWINQWDGHVPDGLLDLGVPPLQR